MQFYGKHYYRRKIESNKESHPSNLIFMKKLICRSLAENYKSDIRSPSSIIQMIGKLCNASGLVDEDSRQCSGIKLYPARRFYPFSGQDEFKLFNSSATNEVLNITQNIMGFHNCESAHIVNIVMGNGTAYDSIAQTHCPRIYAEHKEF